MDLNGLLQLLNVLGFLSFWFCFRALLLSFQCLWITQDLVKMQN